MTEAISATFATGATVQLRSGSPEMTVVFCDRGAVHVCWHIGHSVMRDCFPVEALAPSISGVKKTK